MDFYNMEHVIDLVDPKKKIQVLDRKLVNGLLQLTCTDGVKVTLRRNAPVGKGDILISEGDGYAVELPNSRGSVSLAPPWSRNICLRSVNDLPVIIKEIETEEEFEGYKRLTEFHYRGSGGAGRRVPLVAVANTWELPSIVGFIELSSSFLVNTARNKVLDAPFSDSFSGVGWTKWESKTVKKFGNSIVRISRCVVFPELRGVGLSSVLVDAAVEFAKKRWHIGGLRPSFVEITAEMLRYWPFVESCGFSFVGETEGNQHRMAKDMQYLLGRTMQDKELPQGGGGIMSQQRTHAGILADVMRKRDLSLGQIVNYLQISPDKLKDEDWVQLHKVYRRPKPTYMKGLSEAAEAFINRRAGIIKKPKTMPPQKAQTPNKIIVEISDINLSVNCRPIATVRGRRVQEAFGIVSTELSTTLIESFDFSIKSGEVVLVGGPSGTGKSLFLKSLRRLVAQSHNRGRLPKTVKLDGTLHTPTVKISWPKQPPKDKAPVEMLGDYSLEESLQILAASGLAEAQLFVRPSGTLSVGQAYRLSLALAISEKPDLLLIDEFCEPLDRFTTVAVARNIKKAAKIYGMGVVVATADPGRVKEALRPDRILLLTSSGYAKWV